MSEHVKTGEEIVREWCSSSNRVGEYKGISFKEKWVSLSWLKEQINTNFRKSLPDFWSDDDKQRTIEDIFNLLSKEER